MASEEGKEKKSLGGRIPFWAIGLVLVLLALAVFGDKGILRALQFRRQKAELEQQLKQLEAANAALRQEIQSLHNDRRYLEHIARKELGMVRDDELVYQFPTGKSLQSGASPKP